jgi:outer membrane protein assembly factor BamE (lipoprotein component of BamABCDE complex)
MPRALFSSLLLLCLLNACTSSMGNANVRDSRVLSNIHKGHTTQAQVGQLLGQPQRTAVDASGKETWYYNYSEAELDSATFIPIYGIFAGGAKSTSTELMIEFTPQKIVSNYTTTNGNYHYKNFQ